MRFKRFTVLLLAALSIGTASDSYAVEPLATEAPMNSIPSNEISVHVRGTEVAVTLSEDLSGLGGTDVRITNAKTGKVVVDGTMPVFPTYKYSMPKEALYYVQARNWIATNNIDEPYMYTKWSGKIYFISAPASISYKKVNRKTVKIKWSGVQGAKKYKLYRRKNSNKKWKAVASTSKRSANVSLPKNGSYDFKVEAFTTKGGKEVRSRNPKFLRLWWIVVA